MATGKPDFVTDEHLLFLDELRESDITNMYGAGQYLENEFGVDAKKAREILSYWMSSFSIRPVDVNVLMNAFRGGGDTEKDPSIFLPPVVNYEPEPKG